LKREEASWRQKRRGAHGKSPAPGRKKGKRRSRAGCGPKKGRTCASALILRKPIARERGGKEGKGIDEGGPLRKQKKKRGNQFPSFARKRLGISSMPNRKGRNLTTQADGRGEGRKTLGIAQSRRHYEKENKQRRRNRLRRKE